MRIFNPEKAKVLFGTSEEGRWLLEDGTWLPFNEIDHRQIGEACQDFNWTQAIEDGAISFYYDNEKGGFIWIRRNRNVLTGDQKNAFREFIENSHPVAAIVVHYWDYQNGIFNFDEAEKIEFEPELYLTDPIAWEIAQMETEYD